MKINSPQLFLPLSLMASILVVSGCSRSDDNDTPMRQPEPPKVVPPPAFEIPASSLTVNIVDALTDNAISQGQLTVIEDSLGLINDDQATFAIDQGQAVVDFNIDAFADQDGNGYPDRLGTITFVVEADGYLATNISATVDQFGDITRDASLISLQSGSAPAGISVAQTKVDLSQAASQDANGNQVFTMSTDDGSAEIAIPNQIKLVTEDGEVLDNSDLTVQLAAFDPSSEEASSLYPGNTNSSIQNADALLSLWQDAGDDRTLADATEVRIESAGMVAVNLSSQGKKASRIESVDPVTVAIPVAADARHPQTQLPYQAGDSLSVFSLSEGDVSWHYEGQAQLELGADNQLVVNQELTHFSYFNLGFAHVEDFCTGTIYLQNVDGEKFQLKGDINLANDRFSGKTQQYNGEIDGVLEYVELPDAPTEFRFVGTSEGSAKIVVDKTTVQLTESGSIDAEAGVITGIDLCASAGKVIALHPTEEPTPLVKVAQADYRVVEGDDQNTFARVVIELIDAPEHEVSLSYSVQEREVTTYSAKAGIDFVAVDSQRIIFAPGETQKELLVEIIADRTVEQREKRLHVSLFDIDGAEFSNGKPSIVKNIEIRDNDYVTITNIETLEASEQTQQARVRVTFDQPIPEVVNNSSMSVALAEMNTEQVSATWLLDYQGEQNPKSILQWVTLNSGETSVDFAFDVIDDIDVEGDESLMLQFLDSYWVKTTEQTAYHQVTIVDNDAQLAPASAFSLELLGSSKRSYRVEGKTFELEDTQIYEGYDNRVRITLDSATESELDIDYVISTPTGEQSHTLHFLPGEASKLITLSVANDSIVNDDYTLTLTVSSDALAMTKSQPFTVLDNDYYFVHLSIEQDSSLKTKGFKPVEGVEDDAMFAIEQHFYASSDDVTMTTLVSVDDTETTATRDEDYTIADGSYQFANGSAQQNIDVEILDDDAPESSEVVVVNIDLTALDVPAKSIVSFDNDWRWVHDSNQANQFDRATRLISIADNDLLNAFVTSVGTVELETNTDSFDRFEVEVPINVLAREKYDGELTFAISAIDGSAKSGVHYEIVDQLVTLPAGESSATITVAIKSVNLAQAGVVEQATNTLDFQVELTLSDSSKAALEEVDMPWVISVNKADVSIMYTSLDPELTGASGNGG
ncbi:Calx-beta domain-containing protein [Thalassotalea ponticola]|uniref:Calx-beta domain-containing protein n=1 Tax=Thalassotalea ponticola TaxID=1523392 RepID=UPI0025B42DD4|nr:Calx-beta domain-containing protein [Thalassotalea ponticola]MDN3652671.1 Calx-beta domain-containing protein [Thalassotalea ponticola]